MSRRFVTTDAVRKGEAEHIVFRLCGAKHSRGQSASRSAVLMRLFHIFECGISRVLCRSNSRFPARFCFRDLFSFAFVVAFIGPP